MIRISSASCPQKKGVKIDVCGVTSVTVAIEASENFKYHQNIISEPLNCTDIWPLYIQECLSHIRQNRVLRVQVFLLQPVKEVA